MSIGNIKDQGNKGNNFPYQIKNLQLLNAINETVNTTQLSLKAINLEEKIVGGATVGVVEANINAYYATVPTYSLVSKSVFYDTISAKYLAFLTMSTI